MFDDYVALIGIGIGVCYLDRLDGFQFCILIVL
jgi:hypothetical protein